MTINYQALKRWAFEDILTPYTRKDCMLYALGLGYGGDPMDRDELAFVYEAGLKVVPSMLTILGAPGSWASNPATGIDWMRILHGEHRLTLHGALAPEGVLRSRTRVERIVDKGANRGALVITVRDISDEASGRMLASIEHTSFCRADGGFSTGEDGHDPPPQALPAVPEGHPDLTVHLSTQPGAALLYRLNGDWNPIHADPVAAQSVGFQRPILHGLCTYGMAARAILRACCDQQPEKLGSLALRFSAPFYPGETLAVEIWRRGGQIHFRALAAERGVPVLTHGLATLQDAQGGR